MTAKRMALLCLCFATGSVAYLVLDYWNQRNAPLPQRFEVLWSQDVALLEAQPQIPPAWFDVREVVIQGGTEDSIKLLARARSPLHVKKVDGNHRLEVLAILWEEEGVRGVLVQYNLIDLKSQNMIWELARNLILTPPKNKP